MRPAAGSSFTGRAARSSTRGARRGWWRPLPRRRAARPAGRRAPPRRPGRRRRCRRPRRSATNTKRGPLDLSSTPPCCCSCRAPRRRLQAARPAPLPRPPPRRPLVRAPALWRPRTRPQGACSTLNPSLQSGSTCWTPAAASTSTPRRAAASTTAPSSAAAPCSPPAASPSPPAACCASPPTAATTARVLRRSWAQCGCSRRRARTCRRRASAQSTSTARCCLAPSGPTAARAARARCDEAILLTPPRRHLLQQHPAAFAHCGGPRSFLNGPSVNAGANPLRFANHLPPSPHPDPSQAPPALISAASFPAPGCATRAPLHCTCAADLRAPAPRLCPPLLANSGPGICPPLLERAKYFHTCPHMCSSEQHQAPSTSRQNLHQMTMVLVSIAPFTQEVFLTKCERTAHSRPNTALFGARCGWRARSKYCGK
ncbi:MAG: hypothetical protein J3K34DRAFT_161170 [Monoraphidium minutum]|nr:MAG: hypothetical protein J3K34DRAFT_161170 [Monoraphidium minutum]